MSYSFPRRCFITVVLKKLKTPDPVRTTITDESGGGGGWGGFVLFCLTTHSTAPLILDKQLWVTVYCSCKLRKKAGGQRPQKL